MPHRSACRRRDFAESRAVDEHLCRKRVAALRTLHDDRLERSVGHDRVGELGVKQHLDAGVLHHLQQGRRDDLVVADDELAAREQLLQRRGLRGMLARLDDRRGELAKQALLNRGPPAWHSDDRPQADGHVRIDVPMLFDEYRLCAFPRGRDRGEAAAETSLRAADYDHIRFVRDRYLPRTLDDGLIRRIPLISLRRSRRPEHDADGQNGRALQELSSFHGAILMNEIELACFTDGWEAIAGPCSHRPDLLGPHSASRSRQYVFRVSLPMLCAIDDERPGPARPC